MFTGRLHLFVFVCFCFLQFFQVITFSMFCICTGIIDAETEKTMTLPRCGVKDPIGTGNSARRKRYALHGK